MAKNVVAAAIGRNKTVSFGAAKGFHNTGHNWVLHGARWTVLPIVVVVVVVVVVCVRVRVYEVRRVAHDDKEREEEKEKQTIKSMPDEKVAVALGPWHKERGDRGGNLRRGRACAPRDDGAWQLQRWVWTMAILMMEYWRLGGQHLFRRLWFGHCNKKARG